MKILRILTGEVVHKPADATFYLTGHDEVKVVCHEGVTVNDDLTEVGVVVEEGEELSAVVVGEEDLLSVDRAEDYVWSSAAAHCGLATAPEWLDIAALRARVTPAEWQERLRQPSSRGDVAALRRATQTESPLGQPGFVEELEARFDVRLRPLPPGRPTTKTVQSSVPTAELARHTGQLP